MWLSSLWVLLLPLLAGGLLVFTEIGSRWALENTGRILGLEVEYENGTLAGELEIRRLAWNGDSVSVELGDTVLQLSPGCLWRSSVCFRQLFARSLTIAMTGDSAEKAASEDADDLLIKFPVPLVAKSLVLETLSVTWGGGEWRQGRIEAAVEISGSRIRVGRAVIHGANLALRDTGNSGQPFELPQISLPLELQVDELVLEQGSWDLYGNGGELQSLGLKGGWLRDSLQLKELQLQSAEFGRWKAAAGVEFSGKWPLNVKGTGELPQIHGWPELLQRNISFDVSGGLDALAIQAGLTGRIAVSANTVLNVLDSQLPFQLQATLDWPDKLLLSEFLEMPEAVASTTLTAPLSLVASGDLQEQVFQVQLRADVPAYPELDLQLAGSHRSGNLQVDDLRLQDQAGANTLWASGAVDYGNTIKISALLESSAFDLAILGDYGSGSLEGQIRLLANLDGERWDVTLSEVDIKGEVEGIPARVSGYAGINNQLRLLASELHADVNGSQLTLNASGDRTGPTRAHISVDDLSVWLPDSHGKLSLQALVARDWEELTLSGSAEDLRWQDLKIANGAISGEYQSAGEGRFRLDIDLTDLAVGKIELGDTELSAYGTALEQTASLRTEGDIAGSLELTGKIDGEGDWRGQLASTTLETEQGNWHLQAPVAVHVAVARPQMRLEAHCWHFQQTRVCPGEALLGEEGSASMSLDGNLDELSVFLPEYLELKGALAASFKASWAKGQALVLDGEVRGRDIIFTRHYGDGESASVDWERLDLDVNNGAEGLSLDAALFRAQKEIAGIDLRLPVDRTAPISGRVDVSALQLAMFAPFTPVMSALRGELRGSLQLRGTIDKPLADGTLYLSGGQFSLLGNPTELAQFELQLEARGDSAVLQGSGLLGGGELSFTGDLVSRPEWLLQLAIDGDNHEILLPPYTQMKVSETLTVRLSPGLLDLKGNIEVHEGLLEHEQLPEGSVTLSDDVVEVDYEGNVISEVAPFDMRINVGVLIRNKFRILGDMVNATLGGELQLRQSPREPLQVFGNLNVIGGELRAYQQRLRIRRGTIGFSGTPDNPSLNVRAQRKINTENIVVGIYLSGTLKQPKLEVFSDPVLPDEQAMSYLVRGRGIDSGAGAEGMAVALTVGSGLVNQTALVTELNRIPGISGLEFGAEGTNEEDTAATVGGYIGNRLYLSYGMGIYEPINVLTARLYLRTRLWLEVVSRLENSVDLYYSFDIK
jgi:autotransporter translocation and assembly factor TamB